MGIGLFLQVLFVRLSPIPMHIMQLSVHHLAGQILCMIKDRLVTPFYVAQGKQQWALPHVSVPSIAWLDWEALRRAGFEGCVFDKDNTLTEPYADEVAPQLLPSMRRCQQAFNGRLVLFSNSAGLAQFDPQGAVPTAGFACLDTSIA